MANKNIDPNAPIEPESTFESLANYEFVISGGSITFINMAKLVLRGVERGLKGLYNVDLNEAPKIKVAPCSYPVMIVEAASNYMSVITLTHKYKKAVGSGYVSVSIPKVVARRLLIGTGVLLNPTEKEVEDSCGELCNYVAGCFKTELANSKIGLPEISTPKSFAQGVNMELPGVKVDAKYVIEIQKQREFLMQIEVAFHSVEQ